MIYPAGAEEKNQILLISLFPTFMFLSPSTLKKIRSLPGVEAASPIAYVHSLSAVCCETEVRLIGFDSKTNFVLPPLLVNGNLSNLHANEIIIGSLVGTARSDHPEDLIGAKTISCDEAFTIRGIMVRTRCRCFCFHCHGFGRKNASGP